MAVLAGPGGCARTVQASPSTVRFDLAADPQNLNPLFLTPDAASVELQAARLAFEPFIDRDAAGAAGSGAPGGGSDSGRRWGFSRWPNPYVSLAIRRQMERRVAGYRRRCDLYPARNPRPAQSGALARRLRSRSTARSQRDPAPSSFICGDRGRPPRRRTFRTAFHRSSFCRHTSCERSPRWRVPLSMQQPSVGDGPYRFAVVATRRRAALCRQFALLARRARGRNARDSNDSRPFDQSAFAAIGRAGLESPRAGATGRSCAAIRIYVSLPVPTAVVAGLALNTAACAARRSRLCAARSRCRSIAAKSRRRSRWASIP